MSDDYDSRAAYGLAVESVALSDRYDLAMTVEPDGTFWPWLLDGEAAETGGGTWTGDVPEHEDIGPLPTEFAARLRCHIESRGTDHE